MSGVAGNRMRPLAFPRRRRAVRIVGGVGAQYHARSSCRPHTSYITLIALPFSVERSSVNKLAFYHSAVGHNKPPLTTVLSRALLVCVCVRTPNLGRGHTSLFSCRGGSAPARVMEISRNGLLASGPAFAAAKEVRGVGRLLREREGEAVFLSLCLLFCSLLSSLTPKRTNTTSATPYVEADGRAAGSAARR